MPVEIHENLSRHLFDGLRTLYLAGREVELFDAQGVRLAGPPPATPPVVTEPPRILPAGAAIGQSISLSLGTASGLPVPVASWDLTRDGVSIKAELDPTALTMELATAGLYALSVSWSNAAGSVTAPVATLQVAPVVVVPPIDWNSRTLMYVDAQTPYQGTAADVTSVSARGTGGYVLSKTGTGSAVQHVADGFLFADGAYLQSASMSGQPTTDGVFVVVDVTLTGYGTSSGQIVDGSGGHVKLRNNSGALIAQGVDDSTVNLALGAVQYGQRCILAGQIDDLAEQLSGYDIGGNLVSVAHAGLTDPALTRVLTGRYLRGTVHRLAIVGRAEGQPWPVTMQEVVADFRRGA